MNTFLRRRVDLAARAEEERQRDVVRVGPLPRREAGQALEARREAHGHFT